MVRAARAANATVINTSFHRFSPYGVSGVVVIHESHLSIHTWPEYGFAAVDLFTCGDTIDPWPAYEALKSDLKAAHGTTREDRPRPVRWSRSGRCRADAGSRGKSSSAHPQSLVYQTGGTDCPLAQARRRALPAPVATSEDRSSRQLRVRQDAGDRRGDRMHGTRRAHLPRDDRPRTHADPPRREASPGCRGRRRRRPSRTVALPADRGGRRR